MFKKILLLAILISFSLPAIAQLQNPNQNNRANNPDYLRSLELRQRAIEALEAGEHARGLALIVEATSALQAAERFYDPTRGDALTKLICLTEVWQREAISRGLHRGTNAGLFNRIEEITAAASHAFEREWWQESVTHSGEALTLYRQLFGLGSNFDLAITYIVQRGDSLWRIAARPDVYNDARAWGRLWEANRNSRLHYTNSPHLIHPATELEIPR
ncbi:MAG: LysM peptidoglycan-binding domain-containing protein [Spirochaetaceae bacterium]|nr:LysM peptidoglycan-binding domain-containing protein [Spirochaetaceae bacterium]